MMQAVLRNENHPEYGQAIIPFPLSRDQYEDCVKLVEALEIGDALKQDCYVDEICSAWPVLHRLEGSKVNLDELDYLAKRLDSFCVGEDAQFQGMAEKLDLTDIRDMINLTFCCQQATVITDFSNLEQVGKDHYMNLNGGCVSTEELENLDGEETALLLIDSGGSTVTRYGVVYDNGMKLEQLYDGKHFPCYHYEQDVLTVALTSCLEPEDTENITWICLPAPTEQIKRAMLRSGITDPADMCFRFEESMFPDEVDAVLDFQRESIYELNELALAVEKLSAEACRKLGAAVQMAEPVSASQICQLAENLDQFDFVPGAHTPAEYGRYMIQESGRYDYDDNLESFYDFAGYARQRISQEQGQFVKNGYISYQGALSLDELMSDSPEQDFQMGGMQ